MELRTWCRIRWSQRLLLTYSKSQWCLYFLYASRSHTPIFGVNLNFHICVISILSIALINISHFLSITSTAGDIWGSGVLFTFNIIFLFVFLTTWTNYMLYFPIYIIYIHKYMMHESTSCVCKITSLQGHTTYDHYASWPLLTSYNGIGTLASRSSTSYKEIKIADLRIPWWRVGRHHLTSFHDVINSPLCKRTFNVLDFKQFRITNQNIEEIKLIN